VPAGSKPGVIEQEQEGGAVYTALYTPDQKINVVIQQESPEVPPSTAASAAANGRRAEEGATVKPPEPKTIAGRDAYLLTFQHDEKPSPENNLPAMGPVDVANYFFNDSGSAWYTRAAVSTSLPHSEKVAKDLATELTESFRPKS
jgi:hypothetical protein